MEIKTQAALAHDVTITEIGCGCGKRSTEANEVGL